jgi:hypothetical protein
MNTEKYGIPYTELLGDNGADLELDLLYEACRDEFVNRKDIQDQYILLWTYYKKNVVLFARYLVPKVQSVARLNGLKKVDGMYPASLVADRIAKDWKKP